MKKLIVISGIFIAALTFSQNTYAQCDAMKHKDKCISQLADGFTFIKSYVIDGSKANSKGEVEYSFVFSKGTLYMLTIANSNGEAEGIEIKLYDPNHKLLTSNYMNGKYIPLGYKCNKTGVHYMTFTFKDGTDPCGVSVLGFKR